MSISFVFDLLTCDKDKWLNQVKYSTRHVRIVARLYSICYLDHRSSSCYKSNKDSNRIGIQFDLMDYKMFLNVRFHKPKKKREISCSSHFSQHLPIISEEDFVFSTDLVVLLNFSLFSFLNKSKSKQRNDLQCVRYPIFVHRSIDYFQ